MAILASLSYSQRQVATRRVWLACMTPLSGVCSCYCQPALSSWANFSFSHQTHIVICWFRQPFSPLVSCLIWSDSYVTSVFIGCPTQHPGLIIFLTASTAQAFNSFGLQWSRHCCLSPETPHLSWCFHNHTTLIWVPAPFNYPSSLLL